MLHPEEIHIAFTYEQLPDVVHALDHELKKYAIITFDGGLGAGKTTFIKQLLTFWGIDPFYVTSPTFTYLNQYKTSDMITIFHFDLYRLQTLDDFTAAGFDEYLYQKNSKVFIEWPDIVMPLLKTSVVHLSFEYGTEQNERILSVKKSDLL